MDRRALPWLLGTCLTLLASLFLAERLLRRVLEAQEAMLRTLTGPVETTPPPTSIYSQPLTADLPTWATGMTEEDLREGRDPLGPEGRPLNW